MQKQTVKIPKWTSYFYTADYLPQYTDNDVKMATNVFLLKGSEEWSVFTINSLENIINTSTHLFYDFKSHCEWKKKTDYKCNVVDT